MHILHLCSDQSQDLSTISKTTLSKRSHRWSKTLIIQCGPAYPFRAHISRDTFCRINMYTRVHTIERALFLNNLCNTKQNAVCIKSLNLYASRCSHSIEKGSK